MGLSPENAKALHVLMPELAGGLMRYAEQGIETGSFLRACLEFDLQAAYARADATNRERVPAIFDWIGKNMPEGSFGSEGNVNSWIADMKAQRLEKAKAERIYAQAATLQNLNTYNDRRNRAITDGRMLHQDPPT